VDEQGGDYFYRIYVIVQCRGRQYTSGLPVPVYYASPALRRPSSFNSQNALEQRRKYT
jgi:hypothetical protein